MLWFWERMFNNWTEMQSPEANKMSPFEGKQNRVVFVGWAAASINNSRQHTNFNDWSSQDIFLGKGGRGGGGCGNMSALTITLAYHCHKLNLVLHHKTIIIALWYIIILRPDNGMNSSSTSIEGLQDFGIMVRVLRVYIHIKVTSCFAQVIDPLSCGNHANSMLHTVLSTGVLWCGIAEHYTTEALSIDAS